MSYSTSSLSDERRAEVEAAFREFDGDGDGEITLEEAHAVLEHVLGYSKDATRRLMRACDVSRTGTLSFDEFVMFYSKVKEKVQEMKAMFSEFDQDQDGYIELWEAKLALHRALGMSEEEVEQLMWIYDENSDGRLQYHEFVKLWNAS